MVVVVPGAVVVPVAVAVVVLVSALRGVAVPGGMVMAVRSFAPSWAGVVVLAGRGHRPMSLSVAGTAWMAVSVRWWSGVADTR